MAKLLEEAFKAAAELAVAQQDMLAQAILEITRQAQWDRRFQETASELERLAHEAVAEYRGRTQPFHSDAGVTSHTTQRFRDAVATLPPHVRQKAPHAFRPFRAHPNLPAPSFRSIHATRPIASPWVADGYRALCVREADVLVWFWIGSDAEYDRLIASL